MAVVLKSVPLRPSRRQWQHGIQTIQGLDGGLLVDAKHGRMLRRIEVQPDDVGRLGLELGVVGGHVSFQPMRLDSGARPDPRHHHVANAQVIGAEVRPRRKAGLKGDRGIRFVQLYWEPLAGLVERVTFHSADSGFGFLRHLKLVGIAIWSRC